MVIGATDSGLLMIRGSRGGADGLVGYEFPGGLVDPGEDAATAAARELEEETGYRASALTPLGSFLTIAAVSSSRCHVFYAAVSSEGAQQLESGEDWVPIVVNSETLQSLVEGAAIQDASTLAALALYMAKKP